MDIDSKCLSVFKSFINDIIKVFPEYKIKLEDALRMGAIVRGMELSEDEVRESEKIADQVRADIFATGDEVLIRMTRKVPDECLARFRKILNNEYNR